MQKVQKINLTIFVKLLICSGIGILFLGLNGCSDDPSSSAGTPSTPSAKDFTILYSDANPKIYTDTGYVQTELDVTVTTDNLKDIALVEGTIVSFATEWGSFVPALNSSLAANTCALDISGKCSVKWRSGKPGAADPIGRVPTDCRVAFTAWTTGEEAFIDRNGNGSYDDNDDNAGVGSGFLDLEEPFLATFAGGHNNVFDSNDLIIDAFAVNAIHDPADGLYNGASCSHSTRCGNTSTIIWDSGLLRISDPAATPTIVCS